MIEIKDLKVGDVIQYTEHEITTEEYWDLIAIVREVDIDSSILILNVYIPWNKIHRINRESVYTMTERRRFQKVG